MSLEAPISNQEDPELQIEPVGAGRQSGCWADSVKAVWWSSVHCQDSECSEGTLLGSGDLGRLVAGR